MSQTTRTTLTEEETYFWQKLLVRATHPKLGQPFLSYVLFSLIPVSTPGIKTMGVDKYGRCYVDFDYFMNGYKTEEEGLADATKVLNHEPWHLLRNHHARFDAVPAFDAKNRPRHSQAWNHAGDLTINQDIRNLVPDWGVHVGEAGSYEDFPKNKTTEEYYDLIMAKMPEACPDCGTPKKAGDKSQDKGDQEKGDKGQGNDQGDDKGEDQGEGAGAGDDGEDESDSGADGSGEGGDGADDGAGQDAGDGAGAGDGSCSSCGSKPGAGNCGSSAGNPADYELGEDGNGLTEHDLDGLRRMTAEEVRKIAQSNPGSLPGSLQVWAEDVLKPTPVDWRVILRGAVRAGISWKQGKMDYNRQRRNRRNPMPNIILPALNQPKARITVAADTSGSNVGNLNLILANVVDISKKAGVRGRELSAFTVDVDATDPKFLPNPMDMFKETRGGGGTDMRVAFKVFDKLVKEKRTDICILATDLETPWPEPMPTHNARYIVLGVMNTNDRNNRWKAEAEKALAGWATLVCIYPDEVN